MFRLPNIPARKPGWERSYVEVMERHAMLPFDWTSSAHCLAAPAALCLAMTGVDPMKGFRGYSTEVGALKALRRAGFQTVEDALAATFPDISHLRARRGDCGVLEQTVNGRPWFTSFVVMGELARGKGPDGPVHVPVARLKCCFAIGAI